MLIATNASGFEVGMMLGAALMASVGPVTLMIVREGAVLGMGVFIGKSTKIVDRATGAVSYGEVPPGAVVVAGSMPSTGGVHLYCAVIVKRVDAQTRAKTAINELLRD